MTMPGHQPDLDEALRKIGRHVLHLQRMESMLKFLMLAKFDQKSRERCRELCALLDAQAEKMRPEYEALRSLAIAVQAGWSGAVEALEKKLSSSADKTPEQGRTRQCIQVVRCEQPIETGTGTLTPHIRGECTLIPFI